MTKAADKPESFSIRKIERWHQTLKNHVLLENYFLPGDLERQIEAFIEHYNHRRTLHSPGHG
jgi:putative transposase